MKPLIVGFSDSLNILAFKWRGIRTNRNKVFLFAGLLFALLLVIGAAFTGTVLRTIMSAPSQAGQGQIQNTLVLWLNIFLSDNAELAAGGVFWALVGAIIFIPLVGYSFASIVPEGDLVSIKKTDYHKISDSILLQFVSTISFVQAIVLTALTSIFTLDSPTPGLGIVISWCIWVISVFLTVIAVWTFEYMFRRFGLKSKLLIFAGLLITAGLLWLVFPDEFPVAFGVGTSYVEFVQGLSLNNVLPFFGALGILILVGIFLLAVIGFIASNTLKVTERPKKKNYNKVLIARLGLQDKNKISSLTEFLANMVIRQNNIWKPVALSTGFIIGMSLVFYTFYDVLLTISALIPVMISLVWAINIFGVIGSGTTWLVSLPKGKFKLLSSIVKIQYFVIGVITVAVAGLVLAVYQPSLGSIVGFIIATVTTSAVITQFALRKAVYNPSRYRVHIRGESVLPPDKAFSYMIQLFVVAFFMSILSYGVLNYFAAFTGVVALGLLAQLGLMILIGAFVYARFVNLRQSWVADPEILQNIVKVVGQN